MSELILATVAAAAFTAIAAGLEPACRNVR
jgi:hypothetical protein